MFGKKLIAAPVALIFSICAPIALGKGVSFPAMGIELPEGPAFVILARESIVWAQNERAASEDSVKSPSGSETGESEAVAVDGKKSSEAESKPLAPFVPSEKIPGDQEVDFPVDI